jgi:hypothetical protein
MMHGPEILVASMSVPQPRGQSGERWQYHSRSDLHSKVACWGVFFDMLRTSALLGEHAQAGKVIFGVNFEMRDFATGRKKNLDLVIARPSGDEPNGQRTLVDLANQWGIVLNGPQEAELAGLPLITEGALAGSGVLVALEAKAAMTAHSKARPRLYDELNSSHLTVHGASNQALAVGLVMVNESDTFISPERQVENGRDVISQHMQPTDAERIIRKVEEIPRRASPAHHGFDGLGIVVVRAANDGTPVQLVARPPAPQPGEVFYYDDMLARVANEYDTRFSSI